jgi:hypothetical protein
MNFAQKFAQQSAAPAQQQPAATPAPQQPAPQQGGLPPQTQKSVTGIFAGIGQAKASVSLPWIEEGKYLLRINNVKTGTSAKTGDGLFFEMQTIRVLDDKGGKATSPGTECSYAFWAKYVSAKGNLRAAFCQIMGIDDAQLTEEMMNKAIAEQWFNGVIVECEAWKIITQQGNPFTKIRFSEAIPFSQVKQILTEQEQAAYFPNGLLDQLIAGEQQQQQ